MIFTELPEECWPENFTYPQRVTVDDREEFTRIRDNERAAQHFHIGAPVMYIFADATNVEFADAYTGSLLLPPERLTTPLFKSIAKSKGPFVTLVQYGFSTPNYQGEGQAAKDEQHSRRFLSVMDWVYGAGLSAYDFTTLMARRLAKKLNIHRASSEIGIRNTRIYYYNTSRVETNLVLITPERHFWHMQEPGDE